MAKILCDPEMNRCILCYSCMLACARFNYGSLSVSRCALHIKTAGGMQTGVVADICRSCLHPTCAEVCPAEALVPRKHGGVIFERDRCMGCGDCARACKVDYLRFDSEQRIPLICKHCGICTQFCPHGCIVLAERKESDFTDSHPSPK